VGPSPGVVSFAVACTSATGAGGLCRFLCQCARLAREDGILDAATAAGLPSLSVVRAIVHQGD
jgi:hypothetical protein